MKYYTKDHSWFDSETKKVGLSCFAKEELGEIVYLSLPKLHQEIQKGDELCILESTKSASDVYAPYSGVVTAINPDAIGSINIDPEGLGWLVEITPSQPIDPDDFMDFTSYNHMLQN